MWMFFKLKIKGFSHSRHLKNPSKSTERFFKWFPNLFHLHLSDALSLYLSYLKLDGAQPSESDILFFSSFFFPFYFQISFFPPAGPWGSESVFLRVGVTVQTLRHTIAAVWENIIVIAEPPEPDEQRHIVSRGFWLFFFRPLCFLLQVLPLPPEVEWRTERWFIIGGGQLHTGLTLNQSTCKHSPAKVSRKVGGGNYC